MFSGRTRSRGRLRNQLTPIVQVEKNDRPKEELWDVDQVEQFYDSQLLESDMDAMGDVQQDRSLCCKQYYQAVRWLRKITDHLPKSFSALETCLVGVLTRRETFEPGLVLQALERAELFSRNRRQRTLMYSPHLLNEKFEPLLVSRPVSVPVEVLLKACYALQKALHNHSLPLHDKELANVIRNDCWTKVEVKTNFLVSILQHNGYVSTTDDNKLVWDVERLKNPPQAVYNAKKHSRDKWNDDSDRVVRSRWDVQQ